MWFVGASALLVLIYVALKPLGDGLTDRAAIGFLNNDHDYQYRCRRFHRLQSHGRRIFRRFE